MIYPPATAPPVSRLTTDSRLLAEALEAGRAAVGERLARDQAFGLSAESPSAESPSAES